MRELTFVSWNTMRKPLYNEVAGLVCDLQAHLVILIESRANPIQMLTTLAIKAQHDFVFAPNRFQFDKAQVYYRKGTCEMRVLNEHKRFSIREVSTPSQQFILAVVHLPSKLHLDDRDQSDVCNDLADEIAFQEQQLGHKRTIIVGDFNMNPFEAGMVSAKGLHAVMEREIAQNQSRHVFEKEYTFFYNPMWPFFGTAGKGNVSGTHYHNSGSYHNYYWHIFDQVLIRPELLYGFDDSHLKIVDSIEGLSLINKVSAERRIDPSISDHLPITFKLHV
jgi:endonuclease/exonuclease/phosphatase family metal-dependent hydrolase